MFVKLICLFVFAFCGNYSNAQGTTTCTFLVINNIYTCRLENQNIRNDNDMATINGIHRQNFDDINVQRLDHTTSVVNIFPSLIVDRFVNLQNLHLLSVGLRSLDRTITNCARLFRLELNFNELTNIPR
jgi:hypothetical protein